MGGDSQNGSATIVEALLKLITMDKLGVSLIKEKRTALRHISQKFSQLRIK